MADEPQYAGVEQYAVSPEAATDDLARLAGELLRVTAERDRLRELVVIQGDKMLTMSECLTRAAAKTAGLVAEAVAAERERCAGVCESHRDHYAARRFNLSASVASDLSAAIRRGED